MISKTKAFGWFSAACLALAIAPAPLCAQTTPIPAGQFRFVEADAARDLFNTGREQFDAGKYSQAETAFREVLRKFPKNAVADRSAYYLIRTLGDQGKTDEAKAEIAAFQKTYSQSIWLKDVLEYQVRLTNQVNSAVMSDYRVIRANTAERAVGSTPPAAAQVSPAPPSPPAPPAPPVAPRVLRLGRTPAADENPELTLQREALRVLFDNNPDRAIEIAAERLKNDPKDELVLSSLHLFANSKSDKALPMLISIAKTSPDPKTRRDAVYWISRSRGDKDAITDTLIGFVPSMTSDEDSDAVLYALSQMNTPKAYDTLAGMARDKGRPENVRLTAIQRLGETHLPNRVSLLNDIYKSSPDDAKIRRQAVSALGRGKEPEIVGILAGIASNDSDITVKTVAVNYLGQSKTPEAQKALEDFLLKKKP